MMERIRGLAQKAERLDPSTLDIGDKVMENRIIVLEGYLNFLEQAALPAMKSIVSDLHSLGERVYIGGRRHD